MREREREREAETQAEGEAGSMHREPDMGFDPGSPGSRPGPKAGAKPLRHPGIPHMQILRNKTNEQKEKQKVENRTEKKKKLGIPGWRSGLAPAFGPGRDPGDPGSNPTSGSRCMEPASPSACVSASLSLCNLSLIHI